VQTWRFQVNRKLHMLERVWQELDYRIDVCRVTKGGHIKHLLGRFKTWIRTLFTDVLSSPVCDLAPEL
jgi:hypothetical protein